ncbi:MAG: PA0069 family radical SAM protein [Bacteroidetes bacterium]|nr:MAG: PA0069 family radical SAM protein [Bacteroidota bacterium]
MTEASKVIKGRGAQVNSKNPFDKLEKVKEFWEGIDEQEDMDEKIPSEYIEVFPKSILNKVDSPDIGLSWSMNPYQGCEHGCIYCYARNTHNYWGYSAGTDFEQKVLVKTNAASLLRKELSNGKWEPQSIMFSGNTDCYQPAERKFQVTRQMLEVLLDFRHPVGLITKNSLILRDIDILKELAKLNLVKVHISFTTLQEDLRRKMEPRTSSVKSKLKTIETLTEAGIPVGVMMAPVIPSLNSHEVFELSETVAKAGAESINFLVVRLNGAIGELFEDWARLHFPDRAEKILNQVKSLHGGKLNDSRIGVRMMGEGVYAQQLQDMFSQAKKQYFPHAPKRQLDTSQFVRMKKDQLMLF